MYRMICLLKMIKWGISHSTFLFIRSVFIFSRSLLANACVFCVLCFSVGCLFARFSFASNRAIANICVVCDMKWWDARHANEREFCIICACCVWRMCVCIWGAISFSSFRTRIKGKPAHRCEIYISRLSTGPSKCKNRLLPMPIMHQRPVATKSFQRVYLSYVRVCACLWEMSREKKNFIIYTISGRNYYFSELFVYTINNKSGIWIWRLREI